MRPAPERPLEDRVRHLRLIERAEPTVGTHLSAIDRMIARAHQRLVDGEPLRSDTLRQAA